jgi:hypothetical protein
MGIITTGIPQEISIGLARLNNSTVFVETGTLHGETTTWASNHFETVHTIERAEGLYHLHRNQLAAIRGVTPHLGDSRAILPRILDEIGTRRALFWLDGHWSGGETAGAIDECPLIDELACLVDRTDDIILIDDARLFLSAPPSPHDADQWPTILDIGAMLVRAPRLPFVQIVDDVIFIVPDKPELQQYLTDYSRRRSGAFWEQFLMIQGRKATT